MSAGVGVIAVAGTLAETITVVVHRGTEGNEDAQHDTIDRAKVQDASILTLDEKRSRA